MSISSRRNKVVSAACAALMFASLPMVAMADGTAAPGADEGMAAITNGGDVTFAKTFDLVNEGNDSVLPTKTFSLSITPDETNSVVGVDDTDGAWKTISAAAITLGGTKADATGAWTIDLPEYKAVGTYLYTLQEQSDNELGMTYDTDAYTLKVVVTRDGATLVPHVAVLNSSDQKVDGIKNSYAAGSLSVAKTVTGDQGDVNQKFNIRVTFTGKADTTITGAVSYTPAGATEAVTIPGSDITTAGKAVDLELKTGQTVTFTNIPDDVTYTVEELNSDKSSAVADEGKVTYNKIEYTVDYDAKAAGTIADPTTATTITNAAGNAKVDTGVILNNAPYVVILAAAAVGITVFAVRRHARED